MRSRCRDISTRTGIKVVCGRCRYEHAQEAAVSERSVRKLEERDWQALYDSLALHDLLVEESLEEPE